MEDNFYTQEQELEQQGQRQLTVGRYTAHTFLIMFLGLLVTFAVAWYLGNTLDGNVILIRAYMAIPSFEIILLVVQLVVVIGMSAMIRKISPAVAMVCFLVYAVITGVTFSFYFFLFDLTSLILAFGATALYFGGMAVFGYVTNIDLSRLRTILIGGLIFLIVMNVLMMFIPSLEAADRVLCTIGVVIFLGYTAYDTQKIKVFYNAFQGDDAMLKKASIISALELYLDFINMFIYLLRLLGKSKRN